MHVLDVHSGESVALHEGEGAWFPVDWSPDDTRLLVARYVSANEVHPYVLDLEEGVLTELRPADEPVAYGGMAFDAEGTGVYLTSDEGSEFLVLRHLDLASGELTPLTADVQWDVEDLALSRDRARLAYAVNEEGYSRVHVMDAATHAARRLAGLPTGVVGTGGVGAAGRTLSAAADGPAGAGAGESTRATLSPAVARGALAVAGGERLMSSAGAMAITIMRRIAQTVRRSMLSGHGFRERDRIRPDGTDGSVPAAGPRASHP